MPLNDDGVEDQDPVRQDAAGESARHLRILAVDDSPANLAVLHAMLSRRCAGLVLVSSGCEAIEALRRERFDVALVDLAMPEIDGFAVGRTVVGWAGGEASRHCRLLAISALPPHEVWEQCQDAGFSGFVEKPIDRQALLRALVGTASGRRVH